MLTTNQILLLNQTREFFYSIDWNYGEVFDSNFIDSLIHIGISFQECIEIAKEDTNTYLQLQEQAAVTERGVREFDA